MLTALYLALIAAGVLGGFIMKMFIRPKHWYALLALGLVAFIIHGVLLDPRIGYPPWSDGERAELLKDISLDVRIVSWFSFGVVWGCVGAAGQLLRRQRNANA